MSPFSRKLNGHADCFPRVSGDEPEVSKAKPLTCLFSPRERG